MASDLSLRFRALVACLFVGAAASGQPSPAIDPENGWIGVILPLEAVDVAAQTAGRLDTVTVRAGDRVDAAAPLGRIDARGVQQDHRIASAELEMAEADRARALTRTAQEKARLERRSTNTELWSEEELSAIEVEVRAAEAEARAAEARVEKARATVEQLRQVLEELEIRAPFAGRVSIRYLDPGAVVMNGTPIVRLVSDEALLVRFAVPPEEIDQLGLGDWVAVATSDGRRIGRARVRHLAPEIDLASQRIFVEATLDADSMRGEPKGGLGVEVRPWTDTGETGETKPRPERERTPGG